MLVIMRVGENAPTMEQVDLANEDLQRLIREKTYLEEQNPMDPQVKEIMPLNYI